MENKNFYLAILLSGGFLVFWSTVIMPRYAPHPPIKTPVDIVYARLGNGVGNDLGSSFDPWPRPMPMRTRHSVAHG